MEEVAIFRSAKRRKTKAPRHQESPTRDTDRVSPTDGPGGPTVEDVTVESAEADEDDVSTLVRARKSYRSRAAGVQFSTAAASSDHDMKQIDTSMVRSDHVPEKRIDISDRFTTATGQVVNDDRNMIAYIDSELAKRRNLAGPSFNGPQPQPHEDTRPTSVTTSGISATTNTIPLTGRPSARQLAEVDLGSSAHDRNLARTQAALERAKLGLPPVEDEPKPPKPRKPRLGRDGKPYRPRPRKRRNSEDLARDALVEQLMRENKLDLYDATELLRQREREAAAENGDEHSGESDADERMAEQFRQDFMDAMHERRQRARATTQAKAKAKAKGSGATESRGPKLGGSRSARAKMAQLQQQSQTSGKK
ncbi:hypothetical protein PV08_06002 [Exophiala spinifera]|uniref:Uncharacterized protein n=1 Tax=Exophiala spinifera TaxID=91928 RepID=A0A0D1ZT40_9EURO|nr:uncharacterized protein PV08_06002 [Exophiala spinifera]KIW15952.1 hypothetical protein PV08_06002 [Exophiala spinifera]